MSTVNHPAPMEALHRQPTDNLEVRLEGRVQSVKGSRNEKLVVRGHWSSSQTHKDGVANSFEWSAQTNGQTAGRLDNNRIPRFLRFRGSFACGQSDVTETLILHFSKQVGESVTAATTSSTSRNSSGGGGSSSSSSSSSSSGGGYRRPRNGKGLSLSRLEQAMRRSSRALYSVSGHGHNLIGKFRVVGTLTVENGDKTLSLQKQYVGGPLLSGSSRQERGLKRTRVQSAAEDHQQQQQQQMLSAGDEMRLLAQQWRRRESAAERLKCRKVIKGPNRLVRHLPSVLLHNLQFTSDGRLQVDVELQQKIIKTEVQAPTQGWYDNLQVRISVWRGTPAAVVCEAVVYVDKIAGSGGSHFLCHVLDQPLPNGSFQVCIEVTSCESGDLKQICHAYVDKNTTLGEAIIQLYDLPMQQNAAALTSGRFGVLCWIPKGNIPSNYSTIQGEMRVKDSEQWTSMFSKVVPTFHGNHVINDLPAEATHMRFSISNFCKGQKALVFSTSRELVVQDECRTSCKKCVICDDDLCISGGQGTCGLKCSSAVTPASCTHVFHAQCLLQWAKKKNTCPLCCAPFHEIIRPEGLGSEPTRLTIQEALEDTQNDTHDIVPTASESFDTFQGLLEEEFAEPDSIIVDIISSAILES